MTKKVIIIKMISYVISMATLSCFYSGCFPLLHRLHSEDESLAWEEVGIINEYVKWKITPEIYKDPKAKKGIYFKGIWQANFKNITDKKKRISITFNLLDKDDFTVVSVSRGDREDAIYLSPGEDKIIGGTFAINKKMVSSVYKNQILLGAIDIEESKSREKR